VVPAPGSAPFWNRTRRSAIVAERPTGHDAEDFASYPHKSNKLAGARPKFAGRPWPNQRDCVWGRRMSLWWLSFKGGTTFIVRAETLVHARLLAAADKVARAYLFDAGFQVDLEFEQMIPDELIGRTLSGDEAAELQRRLRGDAQYSRGR
jgi:hypothetical protein